MRKEGSGCLTRTSDPAVNSEPEEAATSIIAASCKCRGRLTQGRDPACFSMSPDDSSEKGAETREECTDRRSSPLRVFRGDRRFSNSRHLERQPDARHPAGFETPQNPRDENVRSARDDFSGGPAATLLPLSANELEAGIANLTRLLATTDDAAVASDLARERASMRVELAALTQRVSQRTPPQR